MHQGKWIEKILRNFLIKIRINDTTISCVSPSSSLNYNNNASISVLYLDSQLPYTFNSIFFYYFKCEGNSCYECMSGQCTWCLDSNTCSNRQANLTCNNKISSTASDCPGIAVGPFSLVFLMCFPSNFGYISKICIYRNSNTSSCYKYFIFEWSIELRMSYFL